MFVYECVSNRCTPIMNEMPHCLVRWFDSIPRLLVLSPVQSGQITSWPRKTVSLDRTCNRLMLHELFPCAYFTSCAQNAVNFIAVIFITNCRTHVHLYFHHCLHVFIVCMFMF